jgi:ABC-type thiamine transport system substrate-binding protein
MKVADYFTKKIIVGLSVVATILTIVGGIWAFETHYATNKRVDRVEIVHAEDMKQLDIELAGALENTQHKLDVRYFQFLHDKYTQDVLELKRQMRRYPEDEMLKEDYRDLLGKKKSVKEKLEQSLEKIKVR